MRRSLVALLAVTALLRPLAGAAQEHQPEPASGWRPQAPVAAGHFMAVAAHPSAARAGHEVLRAGGSVADAAVAVQTVLNLVEPQSSGIGGGAFALYWDADAGTLTAFDGRETAPAAATPQYFLDPNGEPRPFWERVVGGRSVGVPGTLALIKLVHERHGRLAWEELLQPAIRLADAGFAVSARLAQSIASAAERGLARYPAAHRYFFDDAGNPLAEGATRRNPEFARTLRLLAAEGLDAFYRGPIADDIVAAVRATGDNPGLLTRQDFENYEVKVRDPVCSGYRRYRICGMGPPSSGALTVGQMLGMLEAFDLPAMGYGDEAVHLFLEAGKLAFADRAAYMADSDFVDVPVAGLIDPGYLAARARLIGTDAAMPKAEAGTPPWARAARYAADASPERPGTSHITLVDRYGDALVMTTTIETGFGSRLMVRGFLLNNELTDFSAVPERDGNPVANRVEAGKRPRSSMAPTVVFDAGGAQPLLLLGSPGGSHIINYVAKTLIAVLDWGMDIQTAIELGHFGATGSRSYVEAGRHAPALVAALEARGHEIVQRELTSGLHGIVLRDGTLYGGADPRREGIVLGE